MVIASFIILIVVAALVYCSYSISLGLYINSLCQTESKDSVAITFDDGVDPTVTPMVLDTLKKHGAKATFFVIGEKAAAYPELVRRIVAEGHDIGNHSYYHRGSFPMQSSKAMEAELRRCNEAIAIPTKLFRPPFGVTNPMVAKAVKRCGFISIGWSIRSFDTMGHSLERVSARVCSKVRGGDVILLHDNRKGADQLLEMILNNLKNRGLKSIKVTDLFI